MTPTTSANVVQGPMLGTTSRQPYVRPPASAAAMLTPIAPASTTDSLTLQTNTLTSNPAALAMVSISVPT